MKTLLPNLAWLLHLSSYSLPATAAAPSTPSPVVNSAALNASLLSDLLGKNSLVGAIDPTRFAISSSYHETRLPATPVLMTAVDVMVRLALQDWDSKFSPEAFFMDAPRFSRVEFFFSPPDPRNQLEIGFAVLGLFGVMNSVLTEPTQRFRESGHSLWYNRRNVGFIEIRKKGRRPDPPVGLGVGQASSMQGANSTTALSAPAWDDSHLEVSLIRGHEILTIYEVFYSAYALIKTVAIFAARQLRSAPVIDFSDTVDAPPITMRNHPIAASFRNYDDPPRTPRNPPYFQPMWLIKALGRLPQTMMETRDFKEIYDMTIEVDGVKVGTGYIVRRQTAEEVLDTA